MRAMVFLLAAAALGPAATYDVGPGKLHAAIGSVPWDTLAPGDTVRIHWRPEPYREKWILRARGERGRPITVRGVPGPGGRLPVIDGENAVSPLSSTAFRAEERGVLQIRPAEFSAGEPPRWIVIENLEIRNGRAPYGFTASDGSPRKYARNACALYIRGEHIVIRGCTLHGSANGLFAGTPDLTPTRDILIEGNYIYGNGVEGSIYEHNSYTAALDITFQYNRYGPPCPGCGGNGLKDRSAGLTVRHNWIEGGSRELDLVDAEDSSALRAHPRYRETRVYGNILIEPPGAGNNQIVHYGGDSGKEDWYRKGTLYFFHNTVVSRRPDRTTLFRLSTNAERCEARNNVFYSAGPLALLNVAGRLALFHNWIGRGWVDTFAALDGAGIQAHAWVEGETPGFRDEAGQDYRLTADSPARVRGAETPLQVDRQYRPHQKSEPRRSGPSLGAFGPS
jgi:hypothetical protein